MKMKKTPLVIIKECRFSYFGIRGWKDKDYETPLEFQLEGATTKIYLIKDELRISRDRDLILVTEICFVLQFDDVPNLFLKKLRSKGEQAFEAAEKIYSYYTKTFELFEAYLRTAGRLRNLSFGFAESFDEFFSGYRRKVEVRVGDTKSFNFSPQLRKTRSRAPLFKAPQLVTPEKWKNVQNRVNDSSLPSSEVLQLHKLWAEVLPKQKR